MIKRMSKCWVHTNVYKLLSSEVTMYIHRLIYRDLHTLILINVLIGLIASWKQPVYYNYDTPMTKDILYSIISRLHSVGYHVIAIVSDMGPSNVGLWHKLGISMEKTSFEHPIGTYIRIKIIDLLINYQKNIYL